MTLPKMIVFDYGHTLLYEPDWDFARAVEALLAIAQPRGVPAEAFLERALGCLAKDVQAVQRLGYELHAHQLFRLLLDSFGLELAVSFAQAETVFFEALSPGAAMPGADTMLDALRARGIRSGVISNIPFSAEALRRRFDRLLPNHRFEFVIASSEYGVCKPNPLLFEAALHKAGLPAEDVWYCGDSLSKDVAGASAAGLFPVWYENRSVPEVDRGEQTAPKCKHLHIQQWQELTDILDSLSNIDLR